MTARHKRVDQQELAKVLDEKPPAAQMVLPEDTGNLPVLTPQQFDYVWNRCQSKTALQSLRAAYDTSNSSPATQYVDAARMESNPKIRLWLDECRRQGLVDQRTDREQHSSMLAYIRNRALDAGKYSAATTAEYYRGRAERLYVDVLEIRQGELDVPKLLKSIEFLLGADQALIAAGKLGVEYKPNRKKLEQSEG